MPVISDVRHPMLYYDTGTLSLALWDGSLQAGSLVIGAVTQSGTWNIGTVATITNPVDTLSGLEIPAHDYISLSYTGANLTGVVFKTGGSGGTTVATLTLGYSGSDLTSVTKS